MELLNRIERIIATYNENGIKIAIAESCTGGYVSHMLTNISGASNVFERGIVCYSNQAKIDLLGVSPKTIDHYGAVSKEVVEQLASNIRKNSEVDIGIGISGIAGPTGGTLEKPVGTVFIGFSTKNETKIRKYHFKASRIEFKELVLEKILDCLENLVSSN
ncbi:MAG: CinA family protein [Promethearchaeota archaeon]